MGFLEGISSSHHGFQYLVPPGRRCQRGFFLASWDLRQAGLSSGWGKWPRHQGVSDLFLLWNQMCGWHVFQDLDLSHQVIMIYQPHPTATSKPSKPSNVTIKEWVHVTKCHQDARPAKTFGPTPHSADVSWEIRDECFVPQPGWCRVGLSANDISQKWRVDIRFPFCSHPNNAQTKLDMESFVTRSRHGRCGMVIMGTLTMGM